MNQMCRDGVVNHAQAARDAHETQYVERHEGEVEADDPEPERHLAPELVELEAEGLREPVIDAGKHAEQHAADDDVVEVGDQEQAVMQNEVGRRHCEHHARHAADDEGEHERHRPHHRQFEADAAAIHRE